MINLRINHKDFVPLDELERQPQAGELYWVKLNNNDIVLSSWISTNNASGWAKIEMQATGQLYASGTSFYLMKNALFQLAQNADLIEIDAT